MKNQCDVGIVSNETESQYKSDTLHSLLNVRCVLVHSSRNILEFDSVRSMCQTAEPLGKVTTVCSLVVVGNLVHQYIPRCGATWVPDLATVSKVK